MWSQGVLHWVHSLHKWETLRYHDFTNGSYLQLLQSQLIFLFLFWSSTSKVEVIGLCFKMIYALIPCSTNTRGKEWPLRLSWQTKSVFIFIKSMAIIVPKTSLTLWVKWPTLLELLYVNNLINPQNPLFKKKKKKKNGCFSCHGLDILRAMLLELQMSYYCLSSNTLKSYTVSKLTAVSRWL